MWIYKINYQIFLETLFLNTCKPLPNKLRLLFIDYRHQKENILLA
jgi:hypothetical protein